jgi:hypothetical protein
MAWQHGSERQGRRDGQPHMGKFVNAGVSFLQAVFGEKGLCNFLASLI